MGMPAAIDSSIAGRPSLVAGIFTNRFGRSTSFDSRFASAVVPSVSWARFGSTSSETQPSLPDSCVSASTSQAAWMSRMASARKISFGSLSCSSTSRSWSS
jgi:hypothetical protein